MVGTLIGLPVALVVGWLLAKSSIRGKVLLDTLVTFPLVLPPVVTGYFLLILLGRNGPIGQLLHNLFGVDVVFTWVAAALAAGLVSLPLMVRAIECGHGKRRPAPGVRFADLGGWPAEDFLRG